LTSSKHLWS